MSKFIDDPELTIEKRGNLAIITLFRASSLNALSIEMIRLLSSGLDKIASDPDIKAVILKGEGSKAFCAGGDVKLASRMGMSYRQGEVSDDIATLYFREEYVLDHKLYHFEKPVIAFMDGITMGGGVGLAHPSEFRVATEHTVFAMPEVKIGFFPDVGGTFYLQNWPGKTGLFAVTTGYHIKDAGDLLYIGAATHYITSDKLEQVTQDLEKTLASPDFSGTDDIERTLGSFHQSLEGKGALETNQDLIDEIFGLTDFDSVYTALLDNSNDFTRDAIHLINIASPTSLRVSYEYYKMNEGKDFDTIINRDYRMVRKFINGLDFYEGIRAVLRDKTDPSWNPPDLKSVTQDMVEEYLDGLDTNSDNLNFFIR